MKKINKARLLITAQALLISMACVGFNANVQAEGVDAPSLEGSWHFTVTVPETTPVVF
jgi:hypothetical protein